MRHHGSRPHRGRLEGHTRCGGGTTAVRGSSGARGRRIGGAGRSVAARGRSGGGAGGGGAGEVRRGWAYGITLATPRHPHIVRPQSSFIELSDVL